MISATTVPATFLSPESVSESANCMSWPQRHASSRGGTTRPHSGHFRLVAVEDDGSLMVKSSWMVGRDTRTFMTIGGWRGALQRGSGDGDESARIYTSPRSLRYSFNSGTQPGRCFS